MGPIDSNRGHAPPRIVQGPAYSCRENQVCRGPNSASPRSTLAVTDYFYIITRIFIISSNNIAVLLFIYSFVFGQLLQRNCLIVLISTW